LYPARFADTAPTTLEEALATLVEHGDEAKVLAGGQSLLPLLKLRFASTSVRSRNARSRSPSLPSSSPGPDRGQGRRSSCKARFERDPASYLASG
jgi:hypothetical protein